MDTQSCFTCGAPPETPDEPNGSPCKNGLDIGVFHFKHCAGWQWFVQCSQHGQCHEMPCAPGTAWNQDYRTCCHIQDDKMNCCNDEGCESLPFPPDDDDDGGITNKIGCNESSDNSDEGADPSVSADDAKTTYYPMVDSWPPPFDNTADYWCSHSDECDCDACCGIWAGTWFVCIPISDAEAMGNVCEGTMGDGKLDGLDFWFREEGGQ